MNKRIEFEVTLAEDFRDVASGESFDIDIVLEFRTDGRNPFRDAEIALSKAMKSRYPDKKYRVNYWTWKQ